MWADVNTCEQSILFHCLCVCVLAVTQVGTVSVSVQPLLPMLKSVTAEGSTSAGGPRSSVVCQSQTMHSHPRTHTLRLLCRHVYSCLSVTFCFPAALQCENGLVYDPCGPACSPSCPSVQQSPHSQCGALSCVEGCFCPAGMVLHGKSDLQTNPEPSRVMSTYFYVFMGIFQSFMDFQILLNTWYAPQRMMFHALVTSLFHLAP